MRSASLLTLVAALATAPAPLLAVRGRLDLDASADAALAICDEEIVAETCLHLNGGDEGELDPDLSGSAPEWVTSLQLGEVLSAKESSVRAFWRAVELPVKHATDGGEFHGFHVSCADLCREVMDYVEQQGVLPPSSDVACYNVGNESFCDLDVQPEVLAQFGPVKGRDLIDFGDRDAIVGNGADGENSSGLLQTEGVLSEGAAQAVETGARNDATVDIDYDTWEFVERVANLFRVYPTRKPALMDELAFTDADRGAGGGDLNSSLLQWHARGWRQNVKKKEAEAKAYMGKVIRAFNNRRTRSQITRWFGRQAYISEDKRRKIKSVLNSVDHMISSVHYVYPGPECSRNTFAYVYPRGGNCYGSPERTKCTQKNGKYVFYLCDLYFKRPEEQIETLVHEGSHHASAFTNDVCADSSYRATDRNCKTKAYGRSTCKMLALNMPDRAIKNADNFCYYIQDVAEQVQDIPGSGGGGNAGGRRGGGRQGSQGGQLARCPSAARYRTPDRDGDCECGHNAHCYYNGAIGCPHSKHGLSEFFHRSDCVGCECRKRTGPQQISGSSKWWSCRHPGMFNCGSHCCCVEGRFYSAYN